MSQNKKEVIERIITKFSGIASDENKSIAVMMMTAYETGRAEERARWEKKADKEKATKAG